MRFSIKLGPIEFWIGNKEDLHREESYICKAIQFGFIISIIIPFFPDAIYPFSFFQFWKIYPENWFDWWNSSKILFAWGSGLTITYSIINYKNLSLMTMLRKQNNLNIHKVIAWVLVIIFFAGMEEICFRWLIFLGNIMVAKSINFLFFGWLVFGIWEFFHNYIFAPICNWMTLGYLENYLINKELWFVGASIITTNILFRDGHSYQGFFGWINSWFAGIFYFWLTLNYGLLSAILTHSIYNIIAIFLPYLTFYLLQSFKK